MNKQFCPVCMAYMQHIADPANYQAINKYLRCPTCGHTKLAKEETMVITLQDWITSSGRYPERAKSKELTDEVKANAEELLKRVNAAFKELGITKASVSSGFRPSDANKAAGGAKKSTHMIGMAIDIIDDKSQSLCKKFNNDILDKFDLYREDSDFTKGKNSNWCHLQTRKTNSGKRVFKP